MITFKDWRLATREALQPLFEAEAARWRRTLGWDYGPSCAAIEDARSTVGLPGAIACDRDGQPIGWTYYVLRDGRLQVGALCGESHAVVRGLLLQALGSAEGRQALHASCFIYPSGPHVERALRGARLEVMRHAYLRRVLDGPGAPKRCAVVAAEDYIARPWALTHVSRVAHLLAAAYGAMPEARCFAPSGCPSDWLSYVNQIVHAPACGLFEVGLSSLLCDSSGEVAAALLATRLAGETAHIAQVAVGAGHRRKGLARHMVEQTCSRAAAAGCRQVTLLVAESNCGARRLYAELGFDEVAEFLFGWRGEDRR